MSYFETIELLNLVITSNYNNARSELHYVLLLRKSSEAKFCEAVIQHGKSIDVTNEQWFDFFKKIPNMLFVHERHLMNKLTESQRDEIFR
jgi:hypothetical protein